MAEQGTPGQAAGGMAEVTLASMEETAETGFGEGAAGAGQDPSLYAPQEVYPANPHPAPAYDQQPESKKQKREPIWHQFTLPDTKEGMASKKRVCKEPACGCIIHHGLSQWVEHILGVIPGDKKTVKKCISPGIEATMEAERYRDMKLNVDRPKLERVKRTPVTSVNASVVQRLIHESAACVLRPIEFFVAWGGVVTMAYSGFPPQILAIKEKIGRDHSLPLERPGSMWPKTSLGCLRNDRRLTPEQLRALHRICKEEEVALAGTTIPVEELSVVLYESRSLARARRPSPQPERILAHEVVPFGLETQDVEPSEAETSRVRAVLDEFAEDRVDAYWTNVARDGNRESHYRDVVLGSTLVHFLGLQKPQAVNSLTARIEQELPDMFVWFNERSLHITVRGLFEGSRT